MDRIAPAFLGLVGLAGLCWLCVTRDGPAIQADVSVRSMSALMSASVQEPQVVADGRHVRIDGVVGSEAEKAVAEFAVAQLWGVAGVESRLRIVAPEFPLPMPSREDLVETCQDEFDRVLSGSTIEFETDSSIISGASVPLLDDLVGIAERCEGIEVEIGGHTDFTGEEAWNQVLSEQRAQAVREYLISRGIDGERLVAVGYGESRPRADNATATGRALNRRIEFNAREGRR